MDAASLKGARHGRDPKIGFGGTSAATQGQGALAVASVIEWLIRSAWPAPQPSSGLPLARVNCAGFGCAADVLDGPQTSPWRSLLPKFTCSDKHRGIVTSVARDSMTKVLFGTHKAFVAEVEDYIDKAQFEPKFSLSKGSDFSKFDCVVPFQISDYAFLDAQGPMAGEKYYIPGRDVVELCDDKLNFNLEMSAAGFSDFIPPVLDKRERHFPYIIKRRHDENGHNSFIVHDPDDEVLLKNFLDSDDYFCQTCVGGRDEYAAHILMVNGVIHYHRMVHHVMDADIFVKGGAEGTAKPIASHLFEDNPHIDTFGSILKRLNYNGLCCIDYKITDDVPKILEVNPRIGFTVCRDINNFLEAYMRVIHDNSKS